MDRERLRMLVVEDDEDDFVILRDLLSDIRNVNFDLDWARGYAEAVALVRGKGHDVCLLDYRLGAHDGIELMREFHRQGYEAPVIILTGQTDYEIDMQAMKEGAYDYLEKEEIDPGRLERSIRYTVEQSRMLGALKASEHKLRALSTRILEAQENERKYIARELHDSIGASLTAIKYALEEKMRRMKEASAPDGGVSMEQIIDMVRGTIEETRSISVNLRPSVLDDLGLLAAVRSICREFQEVYQDIRIEPFFQFRDEDVPDSLRIVIYRIFQEALNNVSKHSGADKVQLCLARVAEGIELAIEDNGRGFPAQEALQKDEKKIGMGLRGMKERAELTDGVFEIKSIEGEGTAIRVRWRLCEGLVITDP